AVRFLAALRGLFLAAAFLVVFFAAAFLAVFLAGDFLAAFLATFLVAFFAVFLAGRLVAFLAALRVDFFAAFLATFFLAAFLVVFLAAFLAVFLVAFLATFLVAALRTVFLAAFLATFFFATLAVFLAGAFVAFFATFFFSAFFAAMGWLSSSVDLQYCCPVVKQRAGIGPVHNRRRAGRAGTDTAGTTRSGGRGPGNTKTPAARCGAGVWKEVVLFSQRRRCLHPPCRSSGRRCFFCCAFSLCADSLASAATSVGRNLITVFSTVNTPRREFFATHPAASSTHAPPGMHRGRAKAWRMFAPVALHRNESA